MLTKVKSKIVFSYLCITVVLFYSAYAYAACSPGIPCTDYNIYTDTTAGVATALNGPKTGRPTPYTNVTGSSSSVCDGNFMNQIYSNAFMNASREVIMSEQIIHKPDSVLEYTCFDEWVNVAREEVGKIFTEDDATWNNRVVCLSTEDSQTSDPNSCPSGGTNTVSPYQITINAAQPVGTTSSDLQSLIFGNLGTYITNNFAHKFMGESLSIDIDSSFPNASGTTYNCSHMSTVWNIAKCVDFEEDDRFRTFEDLVLNDPRSIPVECSPGNSSSDTVTAGTSSTKLDNTSTGSSTPASSIMNPCPAAGTVTAGVNTGFSNDLIRVANNCDDISTPANLNSYSSFDVMKLYDEMILGVQTLVGTYLPGTGGVSSGVVSTCNSPIPTGVPVVTYEYSSSGTGPGNMDIVVRTANIHYEYICTNPGCYYRPNKIPFIVNGPVPSSTPAGVCMPY